MTLKPLIKAYHGHDKHCEWAIWCSFAVSLVDLLPNEFGSIRMLAHTAPRSNVAAARAHMAALRLHMDCDSPALCGGRLRHPPPAMVMRCGACGTACMAHTAVVMSRVLQQQSVLTWLVHVRHASANQLWHATHVTLRMLCRHMNNVTCGAIIDHNM